MHSIVSRKKIIVGAWLLSVVFSSYAYAQMVAGSPAPRGYTVFITGDNATDEAIRALQGEREAKIKRVRDTYRDRIKATLGTAKIIRTIPATVKDGPVTFITANSAINETIKKLQDEREGIIKAIRTDYQAKIRKTLGDRKIIRTVTASENTFAPVVQAPVVSEAAKKDVAEQAPETFIHKLSTIFISDSSEASTSQISTNPSQAAPLVNTTREIVVASTSQQGVQVQSTSRTNSSKPVSALVCKATIPVLQAQGVGDGCSTSYEGFNLATIPHIGVYRSTFTQACNNHDKCYTTLGNSTDKCNSDFLNEMKSACSSKFSKFWRPIEYATCNQTAYEYKAAVDIFADKMNPGLGFQKALLSLNKRVQSDVNYEVCVTTPEKTNIYSQEVIAAVDGAFLTQAGRKPDTNEFTTAIANNYSPETYTLNSQGVSDYARSRAMYKIPDGEVVLQDTNLVVKNPISGATYIWRINGYPESEGLSMAIPVEFDPRYDTDTELKGYVLVTVKGFSNKLVVDTVLHVQGECGKKTQEPCTLR